jgi:Tol biopolymer transport system component
MDVFKLDGLHMDRLTSDPALDGTPVWSPHDEQIVFDSSRKGKRDLSGRPGSETELLVNGQDKTNAFFSHNGRFVFYTTIDPKAGRDIWVLRVSDRKTWPPPGVRFDRDRSSGDFRATAG